MTALFLELLNRSLSVTWLLLAVFILRFVFKKMPKRMNGVLWILVAVRLLCPFSVESMFSLIPSAETVPADIMTMSAPEVYSGISVMNTYINPVIEETFSPAPGASVNPLQIWIPILTLVWCVGVFFMLLYAVLGGIRLKQKVKTAVCLSGNVYQSEFVTSPFVFGFVKPKVYLPYSLTGQELSYVIAHEQSHIRRKDHIWKLLGFCVLALYWYHPLLWVAYLLFCRDMELACDESVIKDLGREERADYTQTLLSCSTKQRGLAVCPLAFGEVGVKERVKHALNYKKPAFWLILLAVLACIVVAVCFLTNPKSAKNPLKVPELNMIALEKLPADYSLEQAKKDGCVVMENGDVTCGQETWEEFYKTTQKGKAASVRCVSYYSLREPEHYDAEYYEEIKDTYPRMYVFDVTYDGVTYRTYHFEEGKENVYEYPYLMRYEWTPDSPNATFDYMIRYVATDDNQVTWDDIYRGMLSSYSHTYVPRHETVYTDCIYTDTTPTVAPSSEQRGNGPTLPGATVAPSSEQRGDGPTLPEPTVAPSSEQRGKGPILPEQTKN